VSAWGPDKVPAADEVVIGVEEAATEDCSVSVHVNCNA
jgi:hypothetical protein